MITLSFAFDFHTSAVTQFSMMISRTTVTQFTTPLNSFTDGLIPSVSGMKAVGEIIIDGLADGTRPSV
jgi:hypothetical protein